MASASGQSRSRLSLTAVPRQASLYLLFAALLAETSWSGAYFPQEKMFFSELLVAVGFLEFLQAMWAKELCIPRAPAFWLLAAFTTFGAVSYIWSVSPGDTDREIFFMAGLLSVFFVIYSQLAHGGLRTLRSIAFWTVFVSGFIAAWGVVTYMAHRAPYTEMLDNIYRAGSTFEYSNALSCFSLMALPLTAAMRQMAGRDDRPLLAVAISLQTAAVLVSLSRFGAVALVAISLYLMFEAWRRRELTAVALALSTGVVVAVIAAVFAEVGGGLLVWLPGILRATVDAIPIGLIIVAEFWMQRKLKSFDSEGRPMRRPLGRIAAGLAGLGAVAAVIAAGFSERLRVILSTRFEDGLTISRLLPHRLDTYQGAVDAFRVRPLAGSGMGSFAKVYQQYAVAAYTKFAHNLMLQTAVDTGVMGAVLMGLFLAYVAGLSGWRLIAGTPVARALAIAALVFVAYNMFDWEWYIPALTAWFILILACLESGEQDKVQASKEQFKSQGSSFRIEGQDGDGS